MTINIAAPLSRSSLIFLNNLSVESKSNAAEDSSRINTFVLSLKKALPIVIHALMGRDKLNASVLGSTYSPTRSSISSWAFKFFSL